MVGLPLLCALGMLGLVFAALRESFDESGAASTAGATTKLPQRVWLFAAFALAYGICEQIDASWAPLYLTRQLGAEAALGSIALTFFWAISTAGRAFFAMASAKAKPTVVFRVLPFVVALSFAVLALLPVHASGAYRVAAFALAGLGISALLPLVLSLSGRAMPGVATEAASVVFASYLIGYGIAAFGVGPLRARDRTRRRGARIHHRQVTRRSRVSDRYDVIIIGSGAGGGTLAHRLAPSGKRILLLERGDWLPREPKNWDVSAVYVENRYVSKDSWIDKHGKAFQPQIHYFVGGATKMYGAALYRLRAEDFGELVHHDGISPAWPIPYDVMEPYYTQAEQLYQVRDGPAARSTHRESARVGTAHGESRHTIGYDTGERFLSNPVFAERDQRRW